jgi:rod shape determining protein RodA
MEHRIDPWLILAVVGILAASLATLHAAGPVLGSGLLLRQALWGALGLLLVWALSLPNLSFYSQLAPVAYAASIAGLVLVLLLGEDRGGNRAWFAVGPLTIQPSEFARLGVILMVAAWLGRSRSQRLSLSGGAMVVAIVGAAILLVVLEPDLGVALTYLPIAAAALWIGGVPARTWAALMVLAVIGGAILWHSGLEPYQKERVLTVMDPERDPYGGGYQVRQSKIAVGSGQLVGQGLGHGSQSLLLFLPAQHTDFAFSVWSEATGFLGATGLLAAYALLLSRIGWTALAAPTRHGLVLAILVGSWLAFPVLVNVCVLLGCLPTTGIALPLFSYGGSSLLSTCVALGLVQSVWRHRLLYS